VGITCPAARFRKLLLKVDFRGVVPAIARVALRNADTSVLWRYYWDTIEACATPASVMHTLKSAGFAGVDRHLEIGLFSEYRAFKQA